MKSIRGLALCLAVCGACQSISGSLPAPSKKTPAGVLQAGAAKVDITPPPGFPMGGFSVIGRIARGYWTRLWARAIYLEDHQGDALVLTICDLWSIPGGLSDRVAEIVARDEAGRHIGRAQIILAATHTHHSPGNFSTSTMYNGFASPRSGFDPRLFDFLAHRIAAAILDAARSARPATIRWGQVAVGGVARNRSFEAFVLNPEYAELLDGNAGLDVGDVIANVTTPDAYRAIDPTLTVLRIAERENPATLIAAGAFYAVHATAMGPQSEVYSSDLFGVATADLESALNRTRGGSPPAVVALFNGAEGDVSPSWVQQDRANTIRIGSRLAEYLQSLLQTADRRLSGDDRLDISYQFHRFPIPGRHFEDRLGVARQTATRAQPGASQLGGAEDGRTPLFALGWREGVTGLPTSPHGFKQIVLNPWGLELPWPLDSLLSAVSPEPDPPRVVAAGVYGLGELRLATLPGEFTTMMGRRIARGIAAAESSPPARPVVLIGLANEYVSYFTTPEEYAAQHYEGGSTLYGPESGSLVGHDLAHLATSLPQNGAQPTASYSYAPGATRCFEVAEVGAEPRAPDDGLADVVQDLGSGRAVRSYPQFSWEDVLPRWAKPYQHPLTPSLSIEAQTAAGSWEPLLIEGTAETDHGLNLVTVALKAAPPRAKWAAIWMVPDGVPDTGYYRFRVRALDGRQLCSRPFTVPGPGALIPLAPSC